MKKARVFETPKPNTNDLRKELLYSRSIGNETFLSRGSEVTFQPAITSRQSFRIARLLRTTYLYFKSKTYLWRVARRIKALLPREFQDFLFKVIFVSPTSYTKFSKFRPDDTRGFGIRTYENGKATVLIPMHNKVELTISCLRELSLNQDFELARVIVIDDASNIEDLELLQRVRGIEILRLEENVGYLRAINSGLNLVSSKYVVLLNNDTLPQNGWLDALVNFVEKRPQARIAGSKLLNVDGSVQEAGSEIFSSGDIWNLARGFDKDDSRISFNRMVAYCSAASLLVDTKWFQKLGGYDERFAPAYFEDFDLCLEAWNQGFEVWYVHNSVVIHIEGGSHGKSILSGIKKFQEVNREKFFAKWSPLPIHTFDFEEVIPGLFERSIESQGIVVFVEDQIPDAKRDAGSKRAEQIFTSLHDLGFHVILLTLNNNVDPIVLSDHLQSGIEIYVNIEDMFAGLEDRKNRVQYVWVARVGVADAIWKSIKAYFPQTPFIFDTVDLVHLRLLREEKIKESENKKRVFALESSRAEKLEIGYVLKSDHAVVCSEFERKYLISKGVSSEKVSTVWATEDFPDSDRVRKLSRELVTFVGNFKHTPNVDAVRWLIREVLPVVRKRSPNLLSKIRIVGSGLSLELQLQLEEFGVVYLGWVHNLEDLYSKTRLVIAPLRYGAGMKGKILEAISYGCPVLTTSMGAEGFPFQHLEQILISDDASQFAELLCKCYAKPRLLSNLSLSALRVAKDEFSKEKLTFGVERVLVSAHLEKNQDLGAEVSQKTFN
jgi:GT2 family glycosyltransferase